MASALPTTACAAADNAIRLASDHLDLVISLDGGHPVRWRACHPSCAAVDAGSGTSVWFTSAEDPPQARLRVHGPGEPVDLQGLRFTADPTAAMPARAVTLQAELPGAVARITKTFEVSREGYEVVMTVRLLGPNAAAFVARRRLELDLSAGRELSPPPAAGFAAMLDRVHRVVVARGAVHVVGDALRESMLLRAPDWVGFHSRFWALLLRSDGASVLEPGSGVIVSRAPETEPLVWRYTFYAGPLEKIALTHADPALAQLLFSGLWSWLRALSFALLALLRGLTVVAGHPGIAIVALALSVKALLLPLTTAAERLQEQVNATQARLQPGIDAIKTSHRGEERTRRTLALYREHGVHPLYPLKSLVGVLIQLPVFVAVFDMLAEDFDLHRVAFLWIRDLSRPDELLMLPFCLPFFGCHLNLMPFVMSGVSLAALLRFRSPVLTPILVRRQRRNLAAMTALFFLLFYTFPASMVLYWTSTNTVQLARQELGRLIERARARRRR
jgi:YidC/Oxa1 family membrane protein insertase